MNHQTSTVPQVISQVAYQSPQAPTQLMTETPFVVSGFAVPVFSLGHDPIACLNKAMAFLTTIASLRFLTTNNQLRNSSNLRNQATIQDDRARVVKCYNCQGEGHMARQCTQPKRPRNDAWYKEKAMLAEAQEAGQILDEEGKENGLQILQSIDQGPFELGTIRDTLGTTPEGDVRATNIVLQGLPKDIYKLINHNIEAKAIWDNVKMLLAGSELTKEEKESQLYNEFERFKMLPGENINEYYVRFHKLVNDMRSIRMTMPKIELNSKFVNNMSPEWDRFVTAVKLNKGLNGEVKQYLGGKF
ncbi:retrovirus-related pol polyprotein from transposon TNT 1-94 [Tanacetum coccineum]|uniref:Retrovirus-related pol polyprotein from transposon TNT 1-94 n=1 Tax=Tanacetum coccineum TaxID=301880 RepID=A0ABQ5DGP8_9ASTR